MVLTTDLGILREGGGDGEAEQGTFSISLNMSVHITVSHGVEFLPNSNQQALDY